jgi:hypothetical protein
MYHRAQAGMSPHPPNGGWSALRRTYPRTVAVLATLIAAFVVGDVLLAARYLRDRAETERLRNGMTDAERQRADMVADAEENKANVMQELVRRRAAADRALHLSVSVDSGTMLLERDGALLREMRVQVGEERAGRLRAATPSASSSRAAPSRWSECSARAIRGRCPRGSSATAGRRGPRTGSAPGRSVATPSCSAGGR